MVTSHLCFVLQLNLCKKLSDLDSTVSSRLHIADGFSGSFRAHSTISIVFPSLSLGGAVVAESSRPSSKSTRGI